MSKLVINDLPINIKLDRTAIGTMNGGNFLAANREDDTHVPKSYPTLWADVDRHVYESNFIGSFGSASYQYANEQFW